MNNPRLRPMWNRVASLTPRIRSRNRIHRHIYRGQRQYLLHNDITGETYRFPPVVYHAIGLMDGVRSVDQIWQHLNTLHGDKAPDQQQLITLLSHLYNADILVCELAAETRELFRSSATTPVVSHKKIQGNILFFRVPLVDPERFLLATLTFISPLLTARFLLFSLSLIIFATVQTWLHWPELTDAFRSRIFTVENSLIIFCVYPFMKALHELSHSYAVKKWGGKVHEMGIMMLVFMPLPYMDATSATTFRSKWQRVAVGLAGMYAELLAAATAALLWPQLEPGLLRDVVFNIMLIGGISTLLFNANPLIKFDGYYILADLVETPNLAQQSRTYLLFLLRKYILVFPVSSPAANSARERFLLTGYGVGSFIYRLFLSAAIIVFVSTKFLMLGGALALFAIYTMIIRPLVQTVRILTAEARGHDKKRSSFLRIAGLVTSVISFITLVPLPYSHVTEGVLWLPDESSVRIGTDGIVRQVIATPGRPVQRGDVLMISENPVLAHTIAICRSQLREYSLRYNESLPTDRVEAKIIQEQIETLQKRLARYEEQYKALTITSPTDGLFVLPNAVDLPGRFMHQGDLTGYVLSRGNIARVVVAEQDVAPLRSRTRDIEIRSFSSPSFISHGRLLREFPEATTRLPHPLLGTAGDGKIPVVSQNTKGDQSVDNLFQFDILLQEPLTTIAMGKRLLVRFDYGFTPLSLRLYRAGRQLFLKHSNS